jgi:hypothetical protein
VKNHDFTLHTISQNISILWKKAIFKYWTSLNPHLGIFFYRFVMVVRKNVLEYIIAYGRYYIALWQTNNTPNKLLLSESVVSCLLRVRSVSFTSRAKGCIKFVPDSCLVSLSHKVGIIWL